MKSARSKLKMKDGSPRPKQKPRGISKLRLEDPSIPDPLAPYHWKPGQSGNPTGQSAVQRLSRKINEHLSDTRESDGIMRVDEIACGLLTRAEKDSLELERVLRITEPELFGSSKFSGFEGGMVKAGDVSVVFGRLLEKD